MSEQKLRPCPFCGSSEISVFCDETKPKENRPARAFCINCQAQSGPAMSGTFAKAKWNCRSGTVQGVREKVQALLDSLP